MPAQQRGVRRGRSVHLPGERRSRHRPALRDPFRSLGAPVATRSPASRSSLSWRTAYSTISPGSRSTTGDQQLDGAWQRAFDFDAWEYFGSNADLGWGPYCVETGWSVAPSLIGAMLQLTGGTFFPPPPEPGAGRSDLAAMVRADFDAIARAGRRRPPSPGAPTDEWSGTRAALAPCSGT